MVDFVYRLEVRTTSIDQKQQQFIGTQQIISSIIFGSKEETFDRSFDPFILRAVSNGDMKFTNF